MNGYRVGIYGMWIIILYMILRQSLWFSMPVEPLSTVLFQCWNCCGYLHHHLPGVLLCWSSANCTHHLLLLCERDRGKQQWTVHLSPSESPAETLEMKDNTSYSDVGH